jgi:ABC-type bacteriocin/lantibiotic exporter with double-glycine peptidase domain
MDYLTILAQATGETGSDWGAAEAVKAFWEQSISLGQIEAFMFISFGVVWLFYGWRVFKVLVVITFALLGLALAIGTREGLLGRAQGQAHSSLAKTSQARSEG